MVATDLHYLAEDLTDQGEIFEKMVNNSDAKAVKYASEILTAFEQDVIEEDPDALILTGDLTFNGEQLSHEELTEKLMVIEEAGIPVIVLPGNHDIENPVSYAYQGSETIPVDNISSGDFENLYKEFGYDEAIARDANSLSYVYEITDGLWILMIDANTPKEPGTVKEETLEWIEEQLMKAESQDVQVIAASHQNLVQHNLLLADGYVLGNHAELLRMYEKYGVPVNLSGHMHMQHTELSPKELIEIATSSLMVNPLQYGILEIDGDDISYETKTVSGLSQEIRNYAYDLMEDSGYRQAIEITQDEELSRYFADLNTAYFAGTVSEDMVNPELNEQWKQYLSMSQIYLRSILEDPSSFESNNKIQTGNKD